MSGCWCWGRGDVELIPAQTGLEMNCSRTGREGGGWEGKEFLVWVRSCGGLGCLPGTFCPAFCLYICSGNYHGKSQDSESLDIACGRIRTDPGSFFVAGPDLFFRDWMV